MDNKIKFKIVSLFLVLILLMIAGILFIKDNFTGKGDIEDIVKTRTSFKYSTEGTVLTGIYSGKNELLFLDVDTLGEMGRERHEYTFTATGIIYTQNIISYKEPYYINPENIGIAKVEYKRYILYNETMYEDASNGIRRVVSEEFKEETVADMQDYIGELEGKNAAIDLKPQHFERNGNEAYVSNEKICGTVTG